MSLLHEVIDILPYWVSYVVSIVKIWEKIGCITTAVYSICESTDHVTMALYIVGLCSLEQD